MIIKKDTKMRTDMVYLSDHIFNENYHYFFKVKDDGCLYKLGKSHKDYEFQWYSFSSPRYYFGDWTKVSFFSIHEAVKTALNHEQVKSVHVFTNWDDMMEVLNKV